MSLEVNSTLIAAHELKAPLCVIRQLTFALELARDDAERLKIEQSLRRATDAALKKVTDLTRVARLEDGLFTSEPVSVRGLCDAVLREVSPLFRSENCILEARYSNKARLVSANHDLLHSVIYNFCVNALHYSQSGHASHLTVSDRQGSVRIAVRDYGPALPTSIWRELRSGAISRPTNIAMRPGGSGLGLYISSQFAAHMRAKLGAVRHRDGTSFFIDLLPSQQLSLAF